MFRLALLKAYRERCSVSGFPDERLLDAAHIKPHSEGGEPLVSNGLLLSKMHHAAYDQNLIGIDPDYKVHVSEQLLAQKDGPFLQALKDLNGGTLKNLPSRDIDKPDREALEERFTQFQR